MAREYRLVTGSPPALRRIRSEAVGAEPATIADAASGELPQDVPVEAHAVLGGVEGRFAVQALSAAPSTATGGPTAASGQVDVVAALL
jgi:hypothetical protein